MKKIFNFKQFLPQINLAITLLILFFNGCGFTIPFGANYPNETNNSKESEINNLVENGLKKPTKRNDLIGIPVRELGEPA